MSSQNHLLFFTVGLIGILLSLSGNVCAQEAILADHNSVHQFEFIPEEYFETIRDNYRIFYGHTSHGSQIVSGLGILEELDQVKYQAPYFHETSSDLGHNGSTSWVQPTRNWLDENPDCNMVIWSWCGGCSDNTEEGINVYLEAMTQLETDYPAVTFVYMTGHLDGSGPEGNLYQRNNQIREYCAANNKILFDFADIESWDPDGNYYPDEDDGCSWCDDWCVENECASCSYCAHSHCFNCYQKGKAFWSMMANIVGLPTSSSRAMPEVEDFQIWNHPNPFNPRTTVNFYVEQDGPVELRIVDVNGRQVATLLSGNVLAGAHSVVWDGRGSGGRAMPTGIYLVQLNRGDLTHSRKITLLK